MNFKPWQLPIKRMAERIRKELSTPEGRYENLLKQMESVKSEIVNAELSLSEKPKDWVYRDSHLGFIRHKRSILNGFNKK